MSDLADITLAILAGGEGSRMGKPKGMLHVNGRPILEFLLDRLAWPGPTLLVTSPGRQHPPGADRFSRELSDPVAGMGPLRGILTALENSSTDLAVVTAVDMTLVDSAHLRQLVEQIRARPNLLGLMTRQVEILQPLPGIFRIDAVQVVREQLEARQFSIGALTRDPRFAAVELGWDPNVWRNINTPGDSEMMRRFGLVIE